MGLRHPWIALLCAAVMLAGSPAGAQDAEAVEAVATPRKPLPWEIPKEGEDACRPGEIVLLRQLRERALALDGREAALAQREAAAREAEVGIGEELARVETIRTEVLSLLSRAEVASKDNVSSLARMVDAMKAKEAAPMLAGMNDDVALEVLQRIKPKQAAKILGAMPAAKAQALGDRFTILPDPRVSLEGSLAGGTDGGTN